MDGLDNGVGWDKGVGGHIIKMLEMLDSWEHPDVRTSDSGSAGHQYL